MSKIDAILKKLSEPSTYKGLTIIIGLIGYQIEPALLNQIIVVCSGIFGLIEIIRTEKK